MSDRPQLDRAILLALCLLPLAWYFTPLFTDQAYFIDDFTAAYRPWWTYAHDRIREGGFPLWNPYTFSGMPYHTNPENALFYPLKLPLFFLSFFKAAAVLRALNSMVATVGMYALLRHLGLLRTAAIAGSLMFTYGSFMAYEYVHIPYINTVAWLPLEILLLRKLVRERTFCVCAGLALVTAASFLGGSPGVFVICQITAAFFLLFDAAERRDVDSRREQLQAFGMLVIAALLTLALTLVLLLPAFDFIGFSTRAGGAESLLTQNTFTLIRGGLTMILYPYLHWVHGAPYPPAFPISYIYLPYIGSGAVLLAAIGLTCSRGARLAPLVLTVGCASCLMAMGARTGFFEWMLKHVYPLRWFRWPHDYLFMTYFVLVIAAASGIDAICGNVRLRGRLVGIVVVLYAVGGVILYPGLFTILIAGTCLVVVAILCIAAPEVAPRPGAGQALGILFTAILVADIAFFTSGYRLYMDKKDLGFDHVKPAFDRLSAAGSHERVAMAAHSWETYFRGQQDVFGRFLPLVRETPAELHRKTQYANWLLRAGDVPEELTIRDHQFQDLDQWSWHYPVNAAMIYRYQEVGGYDPFIIDRVKELYRTLPVRRTWDLFNVRYVVAPNRMYRSGLEQVHEDAGLHVYENTSLLPRVVVPQQVVATASDAEILAGMSTAEFDPREASYIEVPLPGAKLQTEDTQGTAKIIDYTPEQVLVRADLSTAGLVILHDVYDPGWKAYVDDRELEVLRANYVFRAVWLPAGTHTIAFRYEPRRFFLAARVSVIAWLACLAVMIAGSFRRRQH